MVSFWKNMEINLKKIFKNNWVKLSVKEKIFFLEQLSNLLWSGIPIINSFTIMRHQSKNKKIKIIIEDTLQKLKTGKDLKYIFSIHERTFNSFDISIIEMWELTGNLSESIDTIKEKEEKTKELKWKILWALIYPMLIVFLSVSMIFIFMIYVIPKIKWMYKDAKVNLPDLTNNVIYASEFIQNNINLIILWFIVLIACIKIFKTSKYTKIYWDTMILHIPVFGWLIKKKTLALFTNSLWVLLSRWVIINKALEISSRALENDCYEKKLKDIIKGVRKGENLSCLMWINEIKNWKSNFYFPVELSSVVKIWEQTWRLAELLEKISKKFNKEIDNITKNLSSVIEPVVIMIVWIIIWTLIMAIMLPFFNMVNVI